MAKFRGIKTLQNFASVHASIHNHFNQDRHLNRRDIFKQNRAAALAGMFTQLFWGLIRIMIFEAFYRSGDEERRSVQGIGLGLHLAALHANAMGARIKVEDRSGGGAVFSVRFKTASS